MSAQPPLRWCALKVRIDCPECGSALFVDGPYKHVLCPACGSKTAVADLWPHVVELALDRGAGGKHFKSSSFVWAGNNVPHVLYAANKGHPPLCSHCDEVLDEAEHVADGTLGNFFCPACGTPHPTWPAPGYLAQKKLRGGARVKQVFMAPAEDAQGRAIDDTPATVNPVLFGCLNCGANLRVTGETRRVLTCEYCQADSFLPAEVWNRLHPVRKRRAFWLRIG